MHQRLVLNSKNDNILYISKSLIDDSFSSSPHSHPNLEIILFVSGKGEIITSDNRISVKEKDLIIINPNISHYETGIGLSYYALGINKLDIFMKDSYNSSIIIEKLSNEEFNGFYTMYNLVYSSGQKEDTESNEIIASSYNILYNLLKRKYILTSNIHNEYSDIVIKIKNIIDSYYSSDIKLDEISKRLNSSVSSICHKFKEETGTTIVEYKINKQLEEAYNLLKVSNMTIVDISQLVGFNNVSYFNKLFKEKYNKTPTEIKAGK